MNKVTHPELTPETHGAIHGLITSLAHEKAGKARLTREAMLAAAEEIGGMLEPPIRGSELLSWALGTLREHQTKKRKARKDQAVEVTQRLGVLLNRTVKPVPIPAPAMPRPKNETAPRGKARVVDGDEDPFSAENTSIYHWLKNELAGLEPGVTVVLPYKDFKDANKIRDLLHPVARRLNWTPVETEDKLWKSYLCTIRPLGVYVKRLG